MGAKPKSVRIPCHKRQDVPRFGAKQGTKGKTFPHSRQNRPERTKHSPAAPELNRKGKTSQALLKERRQMGVRGQNVATAGAEMATKSKVAPDLGPNWTEKAKRGKAYGKTGHKSSRHPHIWAKTGHKRIKASPRSYKTRQKGQQSNLFGAKWDFNIPTFGVKLAIKGKTCSCLEQK